MCRTRSCVLVDPTPPDRCPAFCPSYYICYCLPYNIGVGLLLFDLVGIIRHYANLSNASTSVVLLLAICGWLWGWGCDTIFLLWKDKREYPRWLKQLEGDEVNPPIKDPCDKTRFWLRSKLKTHKSITVDRSLPHTNVYTRLMPSSIHGIGVFAIRQIEKGTRLFDEDEEIVWIDEREITSLPPSIKLLYDDFSIIKEGKYGCLPNFNNLTMGWYLNDSENPNVAVDDEYNMSALRDISEGEELTIDSSQFSRQPYRDTARDK